MKTKFTAFALASILLLPNISNAKPSAAARASGSSVASSRSSSSPMRTPSISKAVSPSASMFERKAMRRAGADSVNSYVNSKPAPSSVPRGPSPLYTPPVQTARTATPYSPPPAPAYRPYQYQPQRPAVVEHHYHDNSGSNLLTGMAAGMALGAMASHHEDAVAAPAPRQEPVYNNTSSDYSDYSAPAPVSQPSSGHGFLIFLIIVLLLASTGFLAFLYFRKEQDGDEAEDVQDTASRGPAKPNIIVKGFPNLIPGSIMTVENSYFYNDPNSSNPGIYAELDKTGTVVIVGVSSKGTSEVNLYADRKQDEFARLAIDDWEIEEARYFSYINEYPILGQADWLQWVGNNGMIGNQWFQTGDNIIVKWKRAIFSDTESRIAPDTTTETIHFNDKTIERHVTEMTYYRNTGFSSPFSNREFLLIQAVRTVDDEGKSVCYVRTYSGVSMPPASLQLI